MNEIKKKLDYDANKILKDLILDEKGIVVISKELWDNLLKVLENHAFVLKSHKERLEKLESRVLKDDKND